MRYEGKVYRPWIEADSILIQTTLGCTHNKCTFCNMFRDKRFSIRSLEDIFEDIDEARRVIPRIRSIFLIDGNVLALKTEFLLQILNKIMVTIPECTKISMYAGLNDLRRKSIEELMMLNEAGLSMVYTGLESGDPVTLERIKKGMSTEQAIQGMEHAKAANIRVLASFIFGIGGKERSRIHIEETVKLLNILRPEEIAPMALTIQPGTELEKEVNDGSFVQATPLQILEEEKHLLENMDFETVYWGDHGNNILPARGRLPEHQKQFLGRIEDAIKSHPVCQKEVWETYAW